MLVTPSGGGLRIQAAQLWLCSLDGRVLQGPTSNWRLCNTHILLFNEPGFCYSDPQQSVIMLVSPRLILDISRGNILSALTDGNHPNSAFHSKQFRAISREPIVTTRSKDKHTTQNNLLYIYSKRNSASFSGECQAQTLFGETLTMRYLVSHHAVVFDVWRWFTSCN